MPVKLTDLVRDPVTGETTTIAALAAAGRIRFTTRVKDGRKVLGERKAVTVYEAELIEDRADGVTRCWPISKAAYLSRTRGGGDPTQEPT